MGLLKAGFKLEAVVEAEPGMEDEMQRPMMLLVRAKAKK